MSLFTPTLAANGYRLETPGWGDFPPVIVSIEDDWLVCSACEILPTTPVFIIAERDGLAKAMSMWHRLTDLGYRVIFHPAEAMMSEPTPLCYVAWLRYPPDKRWVEAARGDTHDAAKDAVDKVPWQQNMRDVIILPAGENPNDRRS